MNNEDLLSALSTVISAAALPTMHWLDLSASEMHFVILQKFSIGNFYNFYNLTVRQTMPGAGTAAVLQGETRTWIKLCLSRYLT